MSLSKLTPRISSIGREKFLRYLRDQVRRSPFAMLVIASMMPDRDLVIPGFRDVLGVKSALHERVRRLNESSNWDEKMELARINALLISAAGRGLTDIVKFLLDVGVDVNYIDYHLHRSALHNAILYGHTDTVKLLLDAGADTEVWDGKRRTRTWGTLGVSRRTPLHLAVEKGQVEIVKLLLNAGADKNVKNKAGLTALHFAKWRRHEELVTLLT